MPVNVSSHKALDAYYAALATYSRQDVTHEQATRLAFSTLLDALSKTVGWTLVLEQALANRKRPDGTLYDDVKFPRGYWEAKDTQDDLDAEIRAKIQRGYPLTNTIFEDTRRAVLYQDGRPALDVDITQRGQLVTLLNTFFSYTGEKIEEFHAAVQQFRERIPELARSVEAIIEEQRTRNQRFATAFSAFHDICRQAIDPNISADEIEKMLVQHLLTERLFRTVFDDADFTRRNAIANEIEQVIRALTWNRNAFLQQLDPFYLAIEDAARTIRDFAQKQTFLNTVYERFFQGFSKDQADTHGVVYTPQPIVDFMVSSVDEVLQREFGVSISTPGVKILDPATGTGNFIVNILRRLNRRDLKQKYREDLFANEIMLLPYYIASLNIEHAYYELAGEYEPFEGICFTDTLDLAEAQQLSLFAEENTERVARQKDAEITVIIGNPPYNVGQVNENDNNKNRRYKTIDAQVRATYAKDSRATNKNALDDVYVKFFRWAADRLRGRDGLVCYVSNNSFVDQLAFDGMRKHLLHDFTQVYHLDLHGNVRKNPKLSGTTHNVFGIQVGVGITIAVRSPHPIPLPEGEGAGHPRLHYLRVPEHWTKIEKLDWLAQQRSLSNVAWRTLVPNAKHVWLTDGMQDDFASFLPIGTKEAKALTPLSPSPDGRGGGAAAPGVREAAEGTIFKTYSNGIKANRDDWVYDFSRDALAAKTRRFIEFYNSEVDRWQRRSDRTASVDDFVSYDDTKIKWSETLKQNLARGTYGRHEAAYLRNSLYRPFTKQFLFFDRLMNERIYQQPQFFPTADTDGVNTTIYLTDAGSEKPFMALATDTLADLHLVGAGASAQCFPFYTYNEDGSGRRENITDWALAQFQSQYGASVTKRDIFHYVYAVLHHPHYRARYAENLKRELPRIPLVGVHTSASSDSAPPRNDLAPAINDSESAINDSSARIIDSTPRINDSPARINDSSARVDDSESEIDDSTARVNGSESALGDPAVFRRFVEAGARLAELHLHYERAPEYRLQWIENRDIPFSWRVTKMKLTPARDAVVVNESLTLAGIPPDAFEYRLGNRSALEWIIDQYQVSTDKRSGITSDPNRADDEEYIVRLVGRVITVSVETVKLVKGLPALNLGNAADNRS